MANNLGKTRAQYPPENPAVRILTRGKSAGPDVDYFVQAAGNRLEARGLDRLASDQKVGDYLSEEDVKAGAWAAWSIGALDSTVKKMRDTLTVPIGVQEIVRHPATRTELQLQRARDRQPAIEKMAKTDDNVVAHTTGKGTRAQSLAHARTFIGVTESPPGSNRGPQVTPWQRHTARGATYLDGSPWCGTFQENMAAAFGVATSPRWASVWMIGQDARAGVNGFRGWTLDPRVVLTMDLCVLFGASTHVAGVDHIDVAKGLVYTIEGNTSGGPGGSQSNGGGVFARVRSIHDVIGFALVNYPG
jgi:hypothetical protein